MKIVLINGKKRSGKDYFGKLLSEKLTEMGFKTHITAFADPLKGILSKTFEITVDEFNDLKNCATEIIVNEKVISDFRKIPQHFGTEAMKSYFGDDVWVKLLLNKLSTLDVDFVIVPDFRFNIENVGDVTIKIVNDDLETNDTHASENELNNFIFDYTVDNTGYPDISKRVLEIAKLLSTECRRS